MHKEIINLTYVIISYSFRLCKKWQPAYEQEMPPSWINYFTMIDWKIPRGPTEIAAPRSM